MRSTRSTPGSATARPDGSEFLKVREQPDYLDDPADRGARVAASARARLAASSKVSWRSGQVLFVHAGVNPEVDLEAFLPFLEYPLAKLDEDRHWAWVAGRSSTSPWDNGFSGFFVAPRPYANDAGPRRRTRIKSTGFRLNLDAGSAMTGIAKLAIIRDRYAEVVSARRETKRQLQGKLSSST